MVIGGGLAGSLISIFMAKRGYDVHVYERRPDPRSANVYQGKSINLALSNRGLNALKKVGLDEAILKTAIPMSGRMMHSTNGELSYQPYGKEGQAINSVSRGGLNIRLLELADEFENIHLNFNARCVDVNLDEGTAIYENPKGEKNTVAADRIIGTDGAFAATRLRLQFTELFNYRQDYLDHGYKELHIPPDATNGFRLEKNALHIWPREEFMMIALPNIDGSFTCTLFLAQKGNPSFETLDTKDKVEQFFKRYFPDTLPLIPDLLKDFLENPTGSLVTVRCYPWVYKDKLALLGDAAHAIVPFYGQGMNCAFEDCVVLDQCLEKYSNNWSQALDEYQKLRKPNADAIANLALQNFVEMRDKVADKDFLHRKHIEHELTELYPDIFKSQYELVTFSLEPYDYALRRGEVNNRLLDEIIGRKLDAELTNAGIMIPLIMKYQLPN